MSLEIERKFILEGTAAKFEGLLDASLPGLTRSFITQGYLSFDPAVRIRILDQQAFLTVKSTATGCTRLEFEYEIPLAEGLSILSLCNPENVLTKERYSLEGWSYDFFTGKLRGLALAEIELPYENFKFTLPYWIGEEVTHLKQYSNEQLVKLKAWPVSRG